MKILIKYESDRSAFPYCASTQLDGRYICAWSSKSFEKAKEELLAKVASLPEPPECPLPEEVEI